MNRRPQKFEEMPIAHKIEVAKNIAFYAALDVMVILRRDLGYRIVDPEYLGPVTFFLIVVSSVLGAFYPPMRASALCIYALLAFACGMYRRFRRWRDVNNRVIHHSFDIGTSPFHFRWLPRFLERNRRVERYVDPAVIFCVGWILLFYLPLPALGYWFCCCGACLRVVESNVFEKERNRNLDIVDDLIISERQARVVEQYQEQPQAEQYEQRIKSAVPTGMANDIQERIKRRKTSSPPPPPP